MYTHYAHPGRVMYTGRLETFPDASNASHSAGTCIYRGTQIGCNRRPHREMPRRGMEYASRRREIVASPHPVE